MPLTLTRSLLTILVPGIIATAPWFLFLAQLKIALEIPSNLVVQSAVCFAVVAIVGSVFEGLGSVIESYWDRSALEDMAVQHNWEVYLCSQLSPEPVGYSYLTKLVTSLYFELAMIFAAPCFGLGVGAVAWRLKPEFGCIAAVTALLFAAVTAVYFKWQAYNTHKVLCKTRQFMNSRLKLIQT